MGPKLRLSVKPKELPEWNIHHVIIRNGTLLLKSQVKIYDCITFAQYASVNSVLIETLRPRNQAWQVCDLVIRDHTELVVQSVTVIRSPTRMKVSYPRDVRFFPTLRPMPLEMHEQCLAFDLPVQLAFVPLLETIQTFEWVWVSAVVDILGVR